MAAYASAVSLMHIIDLIKNHPSPPISLDKEQFHSLTEVVTFLQEFLEGYVSPFSYSDEADPLEMRIADAVYAAEDVIESYIVDNIHLAAAATQNDIENYYEDLFNKRKGDDEDQDDDNDDDNGNGSNNDDDEDRDDDNDDGNGNGGNNDDDDDDKDENGDNHHNDDDDDGEEMESYKVYNTHLAAETTHDDEVMESYIVDNIQLAAAAAHEEDEQIRYINFYHGLQKVIEAMDMIKKETMDTERKRARKRAGIKAELPRNVSVDAAFKSSSTESKSPMVGFEDELLQLKERLVGGDSNRQIIPIVGMGGIGKTTLARNVFAGKLIQEHFDICLWATISQDYNIEQTLREVLSSQERGNSGVARLGEELHKYLFGRRYLVVMDDMWSVEVWDEMRFFFPDCGNGSRVIVTTRMSNLAAHLTNSSNSLYMSFLNEVDSWTLFSNTLFGSEGSFPDVKLREIGEKIVGKCKGLPLSIAMIGGLLAKSDCTQEYWEHIEENLSSIVNLENEEYCLRVLKLSYNHLPAYLKPCFLYMGVFDEDSEIEVSTVIRLWVSEGFVKPRMKKSLEAVAREYFQELVDRNLVIVLAHDQAGSRWKWMSSTRELGWVGMKRLCRMHDLVRDLSLKEAHKQRFYYVYSQEHNLSSHSHRRIVIPDIFIPPDKTIGNVHRPRIMLKSSPNSRSFVCHDDDVNQFPKFRLLRTLHTSCLPSGSKNHEYRQKDVFGLVNSRLLAIALRNQLWNSKVLYSSISRLWSLHTLLVHSMNELEGPVEFWKMHQLKHVEFTCSTLCLQLPPKDDDNIVILENLHTLIGMKDFHLNEDVVTRIPNLRILDVVYRGAGLNREVHCLSYLQRLSKLESFRCIIYKENSEYWQMICFPPSLKQILLVYYYHSNDKLEEILQKMGQLPFLEELLIENGVFGSGEWETTEGQFPRLRKLELMRCHGLKKWTVSEASHFPLLQKLILYKLKELEEIPSEIGEIATLKLIELHECDESAVLSAQKIVEEQEELYGEDQLSFRVVVDGL